MRLKVISREALRGAVCAAAMRSQHRADLEFLPREFEANVLEALQGAIEASAGARYDAIVLGWPNHVEELAGLESRGIQLVIPRTGDAPAGQITTRGFSMRSTSWTAHARAEGATLKMIEGDEERDYDGYTTYRQMIYVSTGPESVVEGEEEIDPGVFDRLLAGDWDEMEFLVVPPGWRVKAEPDGKLAGEPIG
jgi:hypothetical protein